MQKQFVSITLVAILALSFAAHAGNVLLLRFGGSADPNDATIFPNQGERNGVFTEQEEIGFTNVDDSFVAVLTNAGHRVTAMWINNNNISDGDLVRINTNDVCLISYSCNSGPFNMNNAANTSAPTGSTNTGHKWNTLITAPMILTKANLARAGAGRLCWFTQMSSNEWYTDGLTGPGASLTPSDFDSANDLSTTASGKLSPVDTNNPIFAGITMVNNAGVLEMSNYFSVNIADPPDNRGNTLATLKVVVDGVDQNYTNDLAPGGRVLATMTYNPFDPGMDVPGPPTVYTNWVITGIAIAEWPANSLVFRYCQSNDNAHAFCDNLSSYRMFFAAGTRDPNGTLRVDGFKAGGYDLTPDGTKIFLRAVDRAILSGSNPSLSVVPDGSTARISWNQAIRTWRLQSSTDLATWTNVTSGVTNNSYTVPNGAPAAQFFRLSVL